MAEPSPPAPPIKPNRPLNLRHAFLLLLVLLIAWVFWKTAVVWLAAYLAVAFTVVLQWLAQMTRRRLGGGYGRALALVVGVIAVVVAAVGLWIGPPLVQQGAELTERLPESLNSAEQWLEQREWGKTLMAQAQAIGGGDNGGQLLSRATGYLMSAFGALGGILAVVAITLFFAATPDVYVRGVLALVPPDKLKRMRELMAALEGALRWWILGRLISMAIVGVFTGLGLWLIGMPLPWVLGFIAGALSFVPNIGPLVSMIPGLLLASTEGWQMVVWALGVYVGVQLVESNLITPMVERYAVSVPPALLLIVQLMMGVLFGVMGLIVATPLMVAVIVTVQMLYVEDRLGRDVEVMGQHEGVGDR